MIDGCDICKGYGLVKLDYEICSCEKICIKCENKDKTGYIECNNCFSTGIVKNNKSTEKNSL